ncbi:MAG: transglutaminase, partial [Methanobrevibacter sp.]|nr:transglutaminase [Methanobrevibacter sp.]
AKLNINLAPASYTITTETSKGEKKSNNVRVISVDPIIHGSDIQGFVNRDINFTVNLAYPNGEPIYDQNIIANINNNKYEAKTNEYGVATFNIKGLDIGNYTINYHYDGYIGFNPCKGSNTIKVVNSTSIFVADDLYIVYGNSSKFPVTLLNLTGIPLAGEVVTFYINGVSYNKTTDEEGIAKININLMPGNYTISYTYSTPDKTDYASGSNRIFISKNPGHLIANNTEVNYGENIHFVVNGYDSNNKPVNNANVLITVDGKDYNLNLVNGSGYYDFNLPVGVNEIYYQFDDLLYSSNVGTNNLTVKGYKLIGNDITVSKGSTSFFEVLVTDTYDNPISNKGVEFTILGNTITNNTDDYGIAKILLPSLTEDTIISYCYSENKTFKGENKISIRPDVDFKDIMIASVWLKNFIEDNFLVPDYVNVGGTDYTTAQFLYMLSEVTVRMSRGEFSGKVSVVDVQDPINPSSSTVQGNLYTYSDLASNIIDFIKNNGIAPDSMDTSIGKSGYDPIVYALTRVVAFYYNNGVLPSYVSLKSASSVIPYSVLDDDNTIADVSPYLDPTKNCQVNDERIQALASKLTSGKTSDWAKAVAIYNYVRDTVSYSFYYNSRYGAYNTLFVSGTANCCDQANAVIALFRAAGLPARYVHGTCYFSTARYGHVWAQVLIGDTWVVADPTSNRNSLGIVVNWNNYNYDLHGKYRELPF